MVYDRKQSIAVDLRIKQCKKSFFKAFQTQTNGGGCGFESTGIVVRYHQHIWGGNAGSEVSLLQAS